LNGKPPVSARTSVRHLRVAVSVPASASLLVRLQIESNWADPFLFAVYSWSSHWLVAILVVMYSVITGGDFESPMFTYMYIGNAFYLFVGK